MIKLHVIEEPKLQGKTWWGISFVGCNPPPEEYVRMPDAETAFRVVKFVNGHIVDMTRENEMKADEPMFEDGYINIKWQDGVVPEVGVNGVQIADVIEVVLKRMNELNAAFPCRENAITITKLQEAAMWQRERTRVREMQGVEGRHVAHQS